MQRPPFPLTRLGHSVPPGNDDASQPCSKASIRGRAASWFDDGCGTARRCWCMQWVSSKSARLGFYVHSILTGIHGAQQQRVLDVLQGWDWGRKGREV